MATLKDIAREVGLNVATVSHVLNESTRPYSAVTRDRVRAAAARMGFVANHAGRRLVRARMDRRAASFDQVGLIYLTGAENDLDPVSLATVGGAEHELSKFSAALTFVRVNEQNDWQKIERLTRAGGVDGWLLYGLVTDEAVDRVKACGLPCVVVGDMQSSRSVPRVNIDHATCGRLAVRHLASLGHRRIAFFGGSMMHVYQQQTLAGFRSEVKELGLENDEALVRGASSFETELDPHQAIFEWLRKSDTAPTAVFMPEPRGAVDLSRFLKDRGVLVPQELSVMACEPASSTAKDQDYTRVELPVMEMGRRAASLLHRVVFEPGVECANVEISPLLIAGWSTGPASRKGGGTHGR